ncbi:oxygenase MpaB family protein [Acidovorax lacteus]|uniref:ER-bound oxygenase mpaB/mpaB'/Rubber oxygenase catalytic domain-containing protein n=1 Tax=Acidovorax lacteus TaxID=1924988 RepID=A0ABP8L661_9BURK
MHPLPPRTFTDSRLDAMQFEADPLADATVAKIFGPWASAAEGATEQQWQRIAAVNECFAQWTDNASLQAWAPDTIAGDADLAMALRQYVRLAQVLPGWAEPLKIERAERVFMEHGALSCILLFCASLPECYVLPDLSAVLHAAGQLEAHTEYRIRSTAAMIFPVMMQGGLTRPEGAGLAQILKVRLIHATIRHLILRGTPQDKVREWRAGGALPSTGLVAALPLPAHRKPTMYEVLQARGWDLSADALPCNQEELAYTLLTFHYVFLRGLRRLGIGLSAADEEAYLHAWNVVGHVLGIQPELMAHSMEQAETLFDQMQMRGRADPVTPDPRPSLGAALMNTMAQSLPWQVIRPWPVLLTRFLCGRTTARDLQLQAHASWLSRFGFWTVMGLARIIDTVVRCVSPQFSITRSITRVLGYHFMSRVLLSQTRPLQLPDALLNQVDGVVHSWSDDPHAPGWLNQLEDRLTTDGTWSHGLGKRTAAQASRQTP